LGKKKKGEGGYFKKKELAKNRERAFPLCGRKKGRHAWDRWTD